MAKTHYTQNRMRAHTHILPTISPCYSEIHSDQPFCVFWLFAFYIEMHSDHPFCVFLLFAMLHWNAFRSSFLCVLTVCHVTLKCIQIILSVCSYCLPCYTEMHSDQPFCVFCLPCYSEKLSDQPFCVFRLFALLQWNTFRSTFLCVPTVCPVTVKYVQINLSVCSDCLPCYSEIRSDQPFCVFRLFALLQWNTFRSTFLCVPTVCPVTVKYVQINHFMCVPTVCPVTARSSWRRNLSECSDSLPCYIEIRSDQQFCVFMKLFELL